MRPLPPSRATSLLLAESNRQMRSAIRSMLLDQKLSNIAETSDSKSFMDTVSTMPFHVILLDSAIANLDAIAVTHLIRSGRLGINRNAAIILLAHKSDMPYVFEAREAGVTDFIAKPFSSAALITRLLSVLEKPQQFIATPTYIGPCRRSGRASLDLPALRQRAEDKAGDETGPFTAIPRAEELLILPRNPTKWG